MKNNKKQPIEIWAIDHFGKTLKSFKTLMEADEWLIKNNDICFQILWKGNGKTHIYY